MPARVAYPALLDLRGARVLVLGAGRVALQKLKGLPPGLERALVVAPQARPALRRWALTRPWVRLMLRRLKPSDLKGCRIVYCCADDSQANAQAAVWARAQGAWVCQTGDPAQGDLQVPAQLKAGGLTLTLSTGGASPALAKALRRRLQAQLAASDLAWLLGQLRRRRGALNAEPAAKRALLRRLTDPVALALALAPRQAGRRRRLRALLQG